MKTKSLEKLAKEFTKFSLDVFEEATKLSSLQKLRTEIVECIEDDFSAVEYADCLMCLFDSAARAGIDIWQLTDAFEYKLEINKNRSWIKNNDNTYSHLTDPLP